MTEFDKRFERLLREHNLTRRDLMQRGGAGALTVGSLAYLAACGGGVEKSKKEDAKTIPKGQIAKTLAFSNWVLYIDNGDKPAKSATLNAFKKKYGTTVKYNEEINDNNEFFGKVRPQYSSGQLRRARPPRGHRLDVQPHEPARLRAALRQVADAQRGQEHRTVGGKPDFDPNRDISCRGRRARWW